TSPTHTIPTLLYSYAHHRHLHSFPTRRSSDLHRLCEQIQSGAIDQPWLRGIEQQDNIFADLSTAIEFLPAPPHSPAILSAKMLRSEEHTSELQSPYDLVCRLLLEKKKQNKQIR